MTRSSKSVLVTGGAGFVGSHLIKELISSGHDVTSVDDYSIGLQINHISGCDYHLASVQEFVQSDKALSSHFDVIFHLAGLSRIQPSFEQPHTTFEANTASTSAILQYAWETNARLIYAGSSSRHHNPYQSPYATSKHLGEELVRMYRTTYNLDAEIVRFYNVYGENEILYGKWAAVIGLWRKQVLLKEPITLVGDGEQKRDFTYVGDIVEALLQIMVLEKGEHDLDAWELGCGSNHSLREVASWFEEYAGASIKYIDNQKGNYRETLRVSNEALTLLGWKPKDQLKEYIRSLYVFEKCR